MGRTADSPDSRMTTGSSGPSGVQRTGFQDFHVIRLPRKDAALPAKNRDHLLLAVRHADTADWRSMRRRKRQGARPAVRRFDRCPGDLRANQGSFAVPAAA